MGFQDNAFKAGSILQDPFSGALGLGAMGDKGRNFLGGLPFVGGMFKGLFGDPEQEAMQRAMEEARKQIGQYREYAMDGRMNAMNQGALAFGPRNQMLGQMMGQRGGGAQAFDLAPMLQNPMSDAHQASIRNNAFGNPGTQPPANAPPGQGGGLAPASGAFSGVGQQNPYRRY